MDIVELLKKKEKIKNAIINELKKATGNINSKIDIDGNEIRVFLIFNKDIVKIEGKIDNIDDLKDKITRAIADNVRKVKEVKDKSLEAKLYALLKKYPAYIKYLERIIKYEEENKDKEYFDMGWTPYAVGATGWEIYQMYEFGIVKLVYESRRNKGYLLVDRERIKRAFEKFKKLFLSEN